MTTVNGKSYRLTQRMAAVRFSHLQKHMLRWLAADHQRTNGVIARSHPELVHTLQRDKGNISHSLRPLERHGFLIMGRSSGGQAESLRLTPEGQKRASQVAGRCDEESIAIETMCCPIGCRVIASLIPPSGALGVPWVSSQDTVGGTPPRGKGNRAEDWPLLMQKVARRFRASPSASHGWGYWSCVWDARDTSRCLPSVGYLSRRDRLDMHSVSPQLRSSETVSPQ
jgi:DNA-binding MarR family transcriptional regulator